MDRHIVENAFAALGLIGAWIVLLVALALAAGVAATVIHFIIKFW